MLICTHNAQLALWHNAWVEGDFVNDINRFSRLLNGTLLPAPGPVLVNPPLEEVTRFASKLGIISCDIETGDDDEGTKQSGLDPTRARIKCIGVGDSSEAISLWWPMEPEILVVMQQMLLGPRLKVLQNGYYFDLRVLRRYGFTINNVADTRDMRRAISTTSPLSLRYLTSLYCDFPDWKENEDEK